MWRLGDDEAMLEVVTSANVACGFHAGDPRRCGRCARRPSTTAWRSAPRCRTRTCSGSVGATSTSIPRDLRDAVLYQLGALDAFAQVAGRRGRLRQAARRAVPRHDRRRRPRPTPSSPRPPSTTRRSPCSARPARRCCGAPTRPGSNRSSRRSPTAPTCATAGSCPAPSPTPWWSTRPRSRPGPCAWRRSTRSCRSTAPSSRSPVRSLCLHGDTPGAVGLARAVRDALDAAGVGAPPVHRMTPAAAVRAAGAGSSSCPRPTWSASPPRSQRRDHPDVAEVVPAARTVLVAARDRAPIDGRRPTWLAAVVPERRRGRPRRRAVVEIAVRYDGEDLDDVAAACGLSTSTRSSPATAAPTYTLRVLRLRARASPTSRGLDPALLLPRRATPRTRVPAGAVAIADAYTAVYPSASPGGWHLIGRTDAAALGRRPRPAAVR